MFNLQKDGMILALGVSMGVAGAGLIGDVVGGVWKMTPFSVESKLGKAQGQLLDLTYKVGGLENAVSDRDKAIAGRDAQIREMGEQSAKDYTDAASRWGTQCAAAFKSGVTVGQAAAKGAPNAPSSPAGQSVPGPVGVQPSFRDRWGEGAFKPAAPAPAAPRGLPRRGNG